MIGASSIPTITASGTGPDFAYHGSTQREGGSIQFLWLWLFSQWNGNDFIFEW